MPTHFVGLASSDGERVFRDLLESNIPVFFGGGGIEGSKRESEKFTVVVPKCFIKHMCFIVLYFHGHAFFSLGIAKKVLFCALFFEKCALFL